MTATLARTPPVRGVRDVLIVQADPGVAGRVEHALRHDGFVTIFTTVEGAREAIAGRPPTLVLLDATAPDLDPRSVTDELRAAGCSAPVILLTARAGRGDRVHGLHSGADGYVVKPFSVEQLMHRVYSVLSRPERRVDTVLRVSDLELDVSAREVRRNGMDIHLTATEFDLLRELMTNARRVLTQQELLSAVWTDDFTGLAHILPIYIGYLRKKIDAGPHKLIHTVRGVGYVLKA